MLADLRMVEPNEFATALHHFTGSKEHNIPLRTLAKEQGLTLNEYGLFRGEERLAGRRARRSSTSCSGCSWIPPELREGTDEIERAAKRRCFRS